MLKGFDPIIAYDPQIMILGSMPSVTSLKRQEYYGFAHNRFWKIMAKHYQTSLTDYQEKVELIKNHHIILWDIIGECEREGSLDSAIRSERVNDIEGLLQLYPSIHKIICNGRKSFDLFMKHFHEISESIEVCYLPSTSNANRSIQETQLFALWEAQLPK